MSWKFSLKLTIFTYDCLLKITTVLEVCPLESDCLPQDNKTVCGTDGQNYPSECVLKARACLMRKDVKAEYDGHCGTKNVRHIH